MSYTTHELLELSKDSSFYPFMALVAYKNHRDEVYVESHNINAKGRMLAGVPLSKACIAELAGSFSEEQSVIPHGILPTNMLYFDSRIGYRKYIWYNPPRRQMMFFHKKLNIPNGQYHIPGIVYVVRGDSLDLYVFEGKKPKDKLYNAPFFNTTNGSVCLGNAKIEYPENPTFRELISYWEKKFWLTEFTHLGGSMNPTKDNLVQVTKDSTKSFDYGQLREIDITLKELLK